MQLKIYLSANRKISMYKLTIKNKLIFNNYDIWPTNIDMENWFDEIKQAKPKIDLARGQLDIDGPNAAREAGLKWLSTQPITYCVAHPQLVESIQKHMNSVRKYIPNLENIVVTHGVVGALSAIFSTFCKPGDEVLLPDPIWPVIPDMVKLVGGQGISYPCATSNDIENISDTIYQKVSSATRIIVINSPHNPTGLVISESGLRRLEKFAKDKHIILLSDEAYDSFGLNGLEAPVLSWDALNQGTGISTYSLSKRFAMPGLRVGFVITSQENATLIKHTNIIQTGGISVICQIAASAALSRGKGTADEIRKIISHRRKFVCSHLEASGLNIPQDRGSIYLWVELPDHYPTSLFVARVILKYGVGLMPSELFSRTYGKALRIGLTASDDLLEEACQRIKLALKEVESVI